MNCPSCGVKLPPDADFCMYCGSQIGGPDHDDPAPPPSEPERPEAPPDERQAPEPPTSGSQRGPWGGQHRTPPPGDEASAGQRGPWGGDYEFPETDTPGPKTDYEFPSGAPKTPKPERKSKSGPPPVPPPPDRMTRWQKLLLGLSIAVLIVIAGTYWIGTQKPTELPRTQVQPANDAEQRQTGRQSPQEQDRPVTGTDKSALASAVGGHLAFLKQGDISGAYDRMSSAFRKKTSVREFAAFVQRRKALWDFERYTIGAAARRNDIMRLEVILIDKRGRGTRARFELVMERGRWRIQSIAL